MVMGWGLSLSPAIAEEGEVKLGHVPRLRCSEAVRDGLEAEKTELQREQRSLTALGTSESEVRTRMGSRWAQYQAPFPLMALVRTVVRLSYRLWAAAAGSGGGAGEVEGVGEAMNSRDRSR